MFIFGYIRSESLQFDNASNYVQFQSRIFAGKYVCQEKFIEQS